MGFLADTVDNFATGLRVLDIPVLGDIASKDYGLSEALSGGNATPNTGSVPLTDSAYIYNPSTGAYTAPTLYSNALSQVNNTTSTGTGGTGTGTDTNNTGTTDTSGDTLGAFTTAGSGTSGYSAGDLAYIDDQIARLTAQKARIGSTLNSGLEQLGYNYNQNVSSANQARGRSLEDLNAQEAYTTRAKDTALDRVDTNARTLRDSLQRRLGMASGSDSSAYQLAAPNAIARDASKNRTGVVENFGENFMALDKTKKRANEDYDSQMLDLGAQKRTAESDYRAGIMGKQNEIDTSLSEAARQKALLLGGGYNQVRTAMQPYASNIDTRNTEINSLFEKYKNPYQLKPVSVDTPTLRDYLVDRTAINANQTQGQSSYSPYAQFLKRQTEEEL